MPTVPLLFMVTDDEVLDVAPRADEAATRKKYHKFALTNHPDKTHVLAAGVCAVREEAYRRASDTCEVRDADGNWGYLIFMQMSTGSNREL
jgi:hypothetical protein